VEPIRECDHWPERATEVTIEWCVRCSSWRCAVEAVGPGLVSDFSSTRLYLKGRRFPADRTTPDDLLTFVLTVFAIAQEVELGDYCD